MKTLPFLHFKKLFLESLLDEDKSRLIDRLVLPDIEDEEEKKKAREEMKAFFKKYSNWENKLDWNKLKTITYADFEKIKDQASQTKGAQKKEIASNIQSIFKSVWGRLFEIIRETDNWLFVAPLTWEAAVYCDSSENQGAGAKWCIGTEAGDTYWKDYTETGSTFIMAFNKNYKSLNKNELKTKLKFMIQQDGSGDIYVWNQEDRSFSYGNKDLPDFEVPFNELKPMFKKASIAMQKAKEVYDKMVAQNASKKIENIKNLEVIPKEYFTEAEAKYVKSIYITSKTKIIGANAFEFCNKLTNVKIEEGVETIGNFAFSGCEKLSKINIPNSVKQIGAFAFGDCYHLTKIVIPNSITEFDPYTFCNCYNLTSINMPNNLKKIGEGCFQLCQGLEVIELPKTIKSIGDKAFYGCIKIGNFIFNGKTKEAVKAMKYYPWGIRVKFIKIRK